MSELKATTAYDAYWKATSNGDNSIPVYLKEEADKVIAEKDAEIRHHKYKHCLAMAMYCHESAMWLEDYDNTEYATFMLRWEKRWLELAEKFKEAK